MATVVVEAATTTSTDARAAAEKPARPAVPLEQPLLLCELNFKNEPCGDLGLYEVMPAQMSNYVTADEWQAFLAQVSEKRKKEQDVLPLVICGLATCVCAACTVIYALQVRREVDRALADVCASFTEQNPYLLLRSNYRMVDKGNGKNSRVMYIEVIQLAQPPPQAQPVVVVAAAAVPVQPMEMQREGHSMDAI